MINSATKFVSTVCTVLMYMYVRSTLLHTYVQCGFKTESQIIIILYVLVIFTFGIVLLRYTCVAPVDNEFCVSRFSKRMRLYCFFLENVTDEQRFQLTAKLCQEVSQ